MAAASPEGPPPTMITSRTGIVSSYFSAFGPLKTAFCRKHAGGGTAVSYAYCQTEGPKYVPSSDRDRRGSEADLRLADRSAAHQELATRRHRVPVSRRRPAGWRARE